MSYNKQRTTTLVHIKKKKIKVAERLSNLFHFIYLMNVVWKLIFFLLLMKVQLIYNIVLVSGLQQSESVIHIYIHIHVYMYTLLGASQVTLVVKNLPAYAGDLRDMGSIPGSGRPWKKAQQPTLVFLLGEAHGERRLMGYGPEGCKESDMTEWLSRHAYSILSFSVIRYHMILHIVPWVIQ